MPAEKIGKVLLKIFGSRNERLIKGYSPIAEGAGAFEEQVKQLDDEQLKNKTGEFKSAIAGGTNPEDILLEAFAVVREAARRNVEMRHFDVQLIGGKVLYEGKIAEMATGEGKTLVATLAAYLVHITGRKIHLVTVNDYLAKRDADWMRPVYEALGLTVGAIQSDMDSGGEERQGQYRCDITYGTNNEFGFDYLRDNMKTSLEMMAQGKLEYAIIDEVDSILIDEARTPLIISGPAFDDVTSYTKADSACRELLKLQSNYDRLKKQVDAAKRKIANARGELSEAKGAKDSSRIEAAQKVLEKTEEELGLAESALARELAGTEDQIEESTLYYNVNYERKSVTLMELGDKAAEKILGLNLHTYQNDQWRHRMEQSLRAHLTFEKEKSYVVMDGKIVIVDEFTGRLMEGRQWSDGLHQAIEAKEGVKVKEETQTLATITLQNFFKLYGQIAGMTGTASTEADEFMNIYKLDVVTIPTNEPCRRDDMEDVIYKSIREKFNAIADEIHEVSMSGRPVLVGTISIEKSEAISAALTKRFGLEHEVLNAKQHAREAVIVTKAGHQNKSRDGKMRGNVTIATNMAGRGTDIKLGEGVADIGGLHILGTERHEARRIDNQLRGRAGRQGDAGSSQFFLSFEDDLMSIFAPDWTVKALSWIGWEEGQPIVHGRISKGIEKAQKKVEERNFEIRKNLLEYDEVMDYQRKIFYSRRLEILRGKGLKEIISEMIKNAIGNNCDAMLNDDYPYNCIVEWARSVFGVDLRIGAIFGGSVEEIEDLIKNQAKEHVANEITLSLGEYLEDYEDRQSWNISGLCKWAMSAFKVGLSQGKVKHLSPEEIEEQLVEAASEQIDKRDCSQLEEFLQEDFSIRMYAEWARSKFDLKLDVAEIKEFSKDKIRGLVEDEIEAKYKRREVEYPVEFAMSMVYGPDGANVYGFEALSDWVKEKYGEELAVEQMQNAKPAAIQKQLLELSERYNNGKLDEQIDEQMARLDGDGLADWANERFGCSLTGEDVSDKSKGREILCDAGKEFLRRELSDLERYVLLQVYDSTWKDHLFTMDHLKDSIHFRAFAEKDPKVEYKREGFRLFDEMLGTIEERVTDTIFKVHLEVGTKAKSVWQVSGTAHDEVGQFAMAERQRAAAQAPQGEQKVKQIKLEQPKVGRNEPCPCGSGKKYKKCCGANG
ncbi:MAG: preprotein translocase subunit SecA [Planctomycetes bacterium]|nr:preprotein translocase subunit SecA [Planctomycetota bacterium]